jgi:hypothetical protein
VCIYSNVAGNIAIDYIVDFLQNDFLNVLVLSSIASFIAHLKACANRAQRLVCIYGNVACNIAIDYFVYFLILIFKCTSLEQYCQLYFPSKSLCKPSLMDLGDQIIASVSSNLFNFSVSQKKCISF